MHAEPATTPRLRKDPAVDCYLDLIARMLTRTGFPDPVVVRSTGWKATVVASLQRQLARRGVRLVRPRVVPATGPAWPPAESAETMLSLARLENVRVCIETALEDGIAGDVVEAGVWRGGTTIYMRAVLAAYGVEDRNVWVADSFRGFPQVRGQHDDQDEDFTGGLGEQALRVGFGEVRKNFVRYGLLDDQVRFLVGWFADTLPLAPIERLAVARIDCDLYESTRDAITALYPKLSPGGFLIVDDYGSFDACRHAVDEYRTQHRIEVPIERIDAHGVYWRA